MCLVLYNYGKRLACSYEVDEAYNMPEDSEENS